MPLKELKIADDVCEQPGLAGEIGVATDMLIDVMGKDASARSSATWNLVRDSQGRPLIQLVVLDPYSSSTEKFAPNEFASRDELWWRLYRLWGNHLQRTSQQQLDQLHQSVLQLEDD